MGQGIAEAEAAQQRRHQDHNAAWWGADVKCDAADDHVGRGGAGDGDDIIVVSNFNSYNPNAVRRDEVVADLHAAMQHQAEATAPTNKTRSNRCSSN